jgi:hypothetical protein
MPLVMAALSVGLVLMALQLWVLTAALDLLLGGQGALVWQLTVVSGGIFVGGLLVLALLRRPESGPPFRPGR